MTTALCLKFNCSGWDCMRHKWKPAANNSWNGIKKRKSSERCLELRNKWEKCVIHLNKINNCVDLQYIDLPCCLLISVANVSFMSQAQCWWHNYSTTTSPQRSSENGWRKTQSVWSIWPLWWRKRRKVVPTEVRHLVTLKIKLLS